MAISGIRCRLGRLAASQSRESTSQASPLVSLLHSAQRMLIWEAQRLREGGPADVSAQPDGGQDRPLPVPKAPGHISVVTTASPGWCLRLCSLRWGRPSPENETPRTA